MHVNLVVLRQNNFLLSMYASFEEFFTIITPKVPEHCSIGIATIQLYSLTLQVGGAFKAPPHLGSIFEIEISLTPRGVTKDNFLNYSILLFLKIF